MRKIFLHLGLATGMFIVSSQLTRVWRVGTPNPLPCEIPTPAVPVKSTGAAKLLDIYRDYAAAQTKHDRDFFERVEDEEFRLFAPWGTYSRTEDINLLNGDPSDMVYAIEDLKIQDKGDAAVVSGRMKATYGHGNVASWPWVDVCVKRDGRWRIVSTTQLDESAALK